MNRKCQAIGLASYFRKSIPWKELDQASSKKILI